MLCSLWVEDTRHIFRDGDLKFIWGHTSTHFHRLHTVESKFRGPSLLCVRFYELPVRQMLELAQVNEASGVW